MPAASRYAPTPWPGCSASWVSGHNNHKKLTRSRDPGRDAQFAYITAQKEHFATRGWPVVSVDAKHRELVGNFANRGTIWTREPIAVNAYDFRSEAEGIAIPYGIYDIAANRGSVRSWAPSHNTPAFAVDNIAKWWLYDGRRRYAHASQLLVLADGGGSNGAKARAWKQALQHRLCDRHGLTVTVCHYPPVVKCRNPVEHRRSARSARTGRAALDSYQTILNYIRTTTTATGLHVKAYLVTTDYPTGVKTKDDRWPTYNPSDPTTQPSRNYTSAPNTPRQTGKLFPANRVAASQVGCRMVANVRLGSSWP